MISRDRPELLLSSSASTESSAFSNLYHVSSSLQLKNIYVAAAKSVTISVLSGEKMFTATGVV